MITSELKKLNLELPELSIPGGDYKSVNIRGNVAFISIQFPIFNGTYQYCGKLGMDIDTSIGCEAIMLAVLNVLAHINSRFSLDEIIGLNHFDAYFNATDEWDDGPIVANAASNLFEAILKEKGEHSRTIITVKKLPRNFCVGITCSFTLNKTN